MTALKSAVAVSLVLALGAAAHADENANADESSSFVQRGFAISPIPINKLNLAGKSKAAVGLGSYIVNGIGDCSGCHSFPQYLPQGNKAGSNPAAGNPYEGTPSMQDSSGPLVANFNILHYLRPVRA